ncbi:MAG: transglutaminase-like domain-containing protein [Chthoniobacter sp.]|nr:transglutaminase-like domain-containing protein [Chthoniobacter sp.]
MSVSGFLFYRSLNSRPKPSPVVAVEAPPAPPEPVVETPPPAEPAPVPKGPDPAIELARVQARIEAVRAVETVRPQMGRGDFTGAAKALEAWLAAHPEHAQRALVEHQVARLRAAEQAVPLLLAQPAALAGAQISVGSAVWQVSRVANGKLLCKVQAQFGLVERPVEISALSEAALLQLMQRADAAGQGTLAPGYLLGLGKTAEAAAALRGTSAKVEAMRADVAECVAVARDAELLAELDGVEALVARHETDSAQERLARCEATFAGHEFLTIAYVSKISDWRGQLAKTPARTPVPTPAPTTVADAYPGLPVFTLSTAVAVGDPDRKQLQLAAEWAASTGNWDRHFTALKNALATAAGSGPWQQHPQNLDRLIGLGTPALATEQARFIRAVGAAELTKFTAVEKSRDFLKWLLVRPVVLAAFNDTVEPQDQAANALAEWRTIWYDDEENREKYANLAIACALVFDQAVRISPDVYGFGKTESSSSGGSAKEVSALGRYRFYRDCAKKGSLKVPLAEMMPWELVWVVDAPVPDSELVWAQQHANFSRRDWGKAYPHIRYRMDRATQGVNPYKAYTLAEIEKEGGVCGDQAYFAAMTAKANGIPAMVISGEGDRGGHAWMGFELARSEWKLDNGRYADNYAAGTTRHPQTGATIKEHELRQLTDPARRTPSYEKSDKLLALSALLAEAGQRQLATVALTTALTLAPKNFDAWTAKLAQLAAAKVTAAEYLRESARMRVTFREFSDLVQTIDKREADYLAANGDADAARKLVHTQTGRMERKDGERSDLIIDNVVREAEMAEKAGETEKVGRIYRDALKDKGTEVVPFKKVAGHYYDWAKKSNKGPETVRELISFFDRKHDMPTTDTFAMGAYRGALGMLIDMTKEQKMEPQQHQLERREVKLKELQEKQGKLQSKGADR